MIEADTFLAAILENPIDDTPRLVFADWLEEHGQTERAEFIRVQCEMASLITDGIFDNWRHHALRRRERELLDGWETEEVIRRWAAWAGELIVKVTGETIPEFRRGFVAEITLPCAAWLEHRDRLLKTAPLERVTLTHWSPASEHEIIPGLDITPLECEVRQGNLWFGGHCVSVCRFRRLFEEGMPIIKEPRFIIRGTTE